MLRVHNTLHSIWVNTEHVCIDTNRLILLCTPDRNIPLSLPEWNFSSWKKKSFAIWLNAPLEAHKPKCIVSIILVGVVAVANHKRSNINYKQQRGFYQHIYHYNLYSIKQPDFQLTFCKTTEADGWNGIFYYWWYRRWSVFVFAHARKGFEVYSKHGIRKHLLASMSSLNRCKTHGSIAV